MHRLVFVFALFSSLLVASWLRPAPGAAEFETTISNTESVPLDPPPVDRPKAGWEQDPNG